MATRLPSAWTDADLGAFGIASDEALDALSAGEIAQALGSCRNGAARLAWDEFRCTLALFDHIAASYSDEELHALEHGLADLYAQTCLQLSLGMDISRYLAEMLLEDALASRDRIPECAALLRSGRIDPRRFHKLVVETELVTDDEQLAAIDRRVAAEISALGSATSLSEGKVALLARRIVTEIDPDAARRRREAALRRRGLYSQTLTDGMAKLTVVASAEDIRLAQAAIDAVIAGLCEDDPRGKAEARSDAVIARLTGGVFRCECDSEGCTATVDEKSIDERAARVLIHVICRSETLDGGDECGYLDGHGPVSADHVRDLAQRADSKLVRHNLDDLSDPPAADAASTGEDFAADDVSGDDADRERRRRMPRPGTPDECRGDDARPDADVDDREEDSVAEWDEFDDDFDDDDDDEDDFDDDWIDELVSEVEIPGDPSGVYRWEPPVDWLCRFEGGKWHFQRVTEAQADDAAAVEHADGALLTRPADTASPGDEADASVAMPCGVISRTSLPSDGYRPTALLEVVARFLWGTCTVPGCEKAAWSCDLDHVDEYDHFLPANGGPTCLCNLAPKCRFHHLIKTNLVGYVDDLILDDEGRYRTVVTISDGMTVETVAPNQWLFPELDRLRCMHQVAAGSTARGGARVGVVGVVGSGAAGQVGPYRKQTRTEVKHAWRRAERARNRRARAAEAETQAVEPVVVESAFEDDGPPPF